MLSFMHKSNILLLHHLIPLIWAQTLLSLLSAAGVAESHSPVMMTWQHGRTSRVLPVDWLAQRKTSDHPWKKSALHSVNSKIKDYVTIKLIHATKPCEINLEGSRECPLTATWGKRNKPAENWRMFWKLPCLCSWEADTFQLGEDREMSRKEGPLGVKSTSICKAQSVYIQLTALGSCSQSFRNDVKLVGTSMSNLVYSAGRTDLFLSSRKHN